MASERLQLRPLRRRTAPGWFPDLAPFGSPTLGSTLYAVAWLVLGCLFAYELYRRRILIKI